MTYESTSVMLHNEKPKTLYVSLDIGSETMDLNFSNPDNKIDIYRSRIPNNILGIETIWDQALTLFSQYGLDEIHFGMETSGPYWFGPYWGIQAKQNNFSDPAKIKISALNPQIVSGFKGNLSYKKQKTDPKDAHTINQRMQFGHFDPVYVPSGNLLALRYYTRYRLHLVKNMVREKLFFVSYLFLKFSEYNKIVKNKETLSSVFGQCSTAILIRYATTEELANAPLDELIKIVEEKGKGRVTDAAAKLETLQKAASYSHPLPKEAVEPINFILAHTLDNIKFLKEQISLLEKECIEPLIKDIDDPIKSIYGIGPVLSAGIIAETPDISKLKGHPALASFLGIIPSMNDSGKFHSQFNQMTKTGSSYGRYYYMEAANSLRRLNPVFKEYFQRKISEDPKKRMKRAQGLTARKLIRVYFHLKKNNCTFRLPQGMSLEKTSKGVIQNHYPQEENASTGILER